MGNTRKGDNTKRAAGIARKAEVADQKAAQQAAKDAAEEEEKWQKGTKGSNKKEADKEKKAEAARKKAERESLLAAEEASLPSRAEPKKSKAPVKKSRGLDLSQLDDAPSSAGGKGAAASSLNATGIDNALDALSLTSDNKAGKVERHPERRYPAAYAKYEARRLGEMDEDGSGAGLRQNQKKERIRKEFEKHPDNPFNQVTASYDASKEELQAIRDQERGKIEKRLGSKS